jgi:SSS family solute:Na+ symporter
MSSWHIGLSVVATDVGEVLNWFRRTRFYNGNIRFLDVIYRIAWCLVSAVFLIPKVSELGHKYKFLLSRKYLVISTTERWRF